MIEIEYETCRYGLYYDSLYGVGYVQWKADGAETGLITGYDMVELRRNLNRAKTNAGSKHKRYRPFDEIADTIFSEYFPWDRCPISKNPADEANQASRAPREPLTLEGTPLRAFYPPAEEEIV